jgi:hypothetical protein
MPTKLVLNIEEKIYQRLQDRFKNDDLGLNQFIMDAIKTQLSDSPADPAADKDDDLESYLKKGSSGSRTYGVKGQGW